MTLYDHIYTRPKLGQEDEILLEYFNLLVSELNYIQMSKNKRS